MTKQILAFGNPVYDTIITPALTREERVLSGCSTNACLAAAKLGEAATLVGCIGPDYAGHFENEMRRRNIAVHLLPSAHTGGFRLVYDQRGDRTLTVLGVADPIAPHYNGYGGPHGPDFVLLGPILGEVPVALAEDIRASTSAPVLLDPQGLLRAYNDGEVTHVMTDEFVRIARLVTVVKANEIETLTITGLRPRKNPEKAVRALRACGCQIAIVTLAEAGSIIYDGRQVFPIPAYATHAIDPTGAGDTYAAGFMVRYLEAPGDLAAVGRFASAVASVMVENSGPEFPLTRAEVERRAAELQDAAPPWA